MEHGGHRENAGRKSQWASGCKFKDTKVIRVPKSIADKVLEYAHSLDVNEHPLDLNELLNKSRELLLDESLVRPRDRSPVKKVLSILLGIEKSYYDRK